VPRAVRDPAYFRVDSAVGRDASRPRAENCAAPPDLPRTRHPPLPSDRSAQLGKAISTSYTAFREILDNPIRRGIVDFWIEERLHGSSLEQTGTYRSSPPQSACTEDRKSTRLNSSHDQISYAV